MSALPWFKTPSDLPHDPRWRMIARRAEVALCEVVAIVTDLWRHAAQHDGSVGDYDEELAAATFDLEAASVRSILQALVDKGVIVAARLADWVTVASNSIAAQPRKMVNAAAERTRRWRAKKLDRERQPDLFEASHTPVTASQTGVTVTGQDKDSESEDALPSGASARAMPAPVVNFAEEKTARAARRTRLPPDWQPGPDGCAFAAAHGYDQRWIGEQADRFADHHRARGTLMADWSAAWRSWVGRAGDFEPRDRGGRSGGNGSPAAGGIAASMRRVLARVDAGTWKFGSEWSGMDAAHWRG